MSTYVQSAVSGSALGTKEQQFQSRKEDLERQINAFTRGQSQKSTDLALNPKTLQSKLSSQEALIDLYEFASYPWDIQARYGAIVSTSRELRFVDLGPADAINQAVSAWRSGSSLRTVFPEATAVQGKANPQPESDQAGDAWLKVEHLLCLPLSKMIPDSVTRLWISDECQLSRLPWSVLMSEFGGLKNYEVCQVDSPRELMALKHEEATSPTTGSTGRMLLVGGIDYSKHVPVAPQLKNSLIEIAELKKEAEAKHLKCVVLSDSLEQSAQHPTRKNIMEELSKCQYGHIVTHGFFNNSDSASGSSDRSAKLSVETRSSGSADNAQMLIRNPLIESGLLVSKFENANSKDSSEDGFMTAEDLLDARLEACRLITLSACDTGRGREVNSQGVIGLRSALMGAGAKTVLLSLWPVPDRATSELMNVFYERLFKGDTPVSALRQAQAAVRSNERWRAPYYWAAWVIVGDGGRRAPSRK